ncbi:contractile injection system tape measure protein [Nocardioides sp.]|uniref:contractile injection system tape measure protein n=1 Tax=Nocardioides sp. TaxID=35761 RepID=UPI0035AFC433
MSPPATIAVRRHVVEVEVHGSENDGLLVQRHLSGTVDGVVARALERALAGVVPEDDRLVVERLDIELDGVPYALLDDALAQAVRHDVEAFFRRHVPPPLGRTDSSTEAPGATTGTAGPIVRWRASATIEAAFVAFLRDGRLPWAFRPPDGDLERAVTEAWASDATASQVSRAGVADALQEPAVRLRVVKQFSAPFVLDLVRRVAPGVAGPLAEASEPPAASGPDGREWSAFLRQIQLAALAAAAEGRTVTADELVQQTLGSLPEEVRADPELVERPGRQGSRASLDVPPPDVTDRSHDVRAAARHGATGADGRTTAGVPSGAHSLLVDHAGVVLLHPFLPRFLAGLGVAAGEELLDADRAVALLHHLATGDEVVPEHATPLAKVLCGVPLGQPVERDPALTKDEVAEASALLRAVVGHWEALRSTSPDALRAEFLTRPGTLFAEGDDWVLRVEDRSVDILLEQLPWGVSMVQTPWMDRMLRVEWRA